MLNCEFDPQSLYPARESFTELCLYPSHIHIPTFLFYLPKSLSHRLPFSFISLILFHCLHEQVDKDVSTSPPNPMKDGVKEPKHKHETVTSEFHKLKKSEPVRQSFGVLRNILWKWGTAACFVIDLLITRWLYVPPFSKPSDHITRAIGQRWGAVNGLHRVQHPM